MASRHTRCPPTLHGPARARFLATQDHYDRMLAAEGFEDLEGGADLAIVSTSTKTRRVNCSYVVPEEADFWSAVQSRASGLPRNYRGRRFITDLAASGNLCEAARDNRLTRHAARWLFKRFLEAHGLGASRPARSTYSGDGRWRSRRANG